MGSISSNNFGDLLGGFSTSESRPRSSQNLFSEDLLGGFGSSNPRSADHNSSRSVDDIFSGGLGHSERSNARTGSGSHNVEDSFLGSFGMSKPAAQVTQSQPVFDDDWGFGASKPAPRSASLHASIDGDLLGGFTTSGTRAKVSTPFRSPGSSPPRAKHSEPVFDDILPGFRAGEPKRSQPTVGPDAFRGIPIITTDDEDDVFANIPSASAASDADPFQGIPSVKSAGDADPFRGIPTAQSTGDADASRGLPPVSTLDADEMRGVPPVTSDIPSDDDPFSTPIEVDPFASIGTDAGPPPTSAFPGDSLDPFSMPTGSVPSSTAAQKVSNANGNDGSGSFDLFDGFPKPSPVATSKAKDESFSDDKEGSQSFSTRSEKSGRRSYNAVPFNVDLNEPPEVPSPSYPSRSYKANHEPVSNGSVPKFDDEPKFDDPAIPTEDASNGDDVVGNPPVDIFEEKWLTIDDVKLVTQPSSSPPPSRAPPRPGSDVRAAAMRGAAEYRLPRERDPARQVEQAEYRPRSKVQEQSKEAELARERAAARQREAAMVQKERETAQRERAERQRERERLREREKQRDRLREQEMPREPEERVPPRQEDSRDSRDNDQAAERAKRAAEKVALEAQQRVEKAAAERAFIEARERAEKAALQRAAAAAREKERAEREERERRERESRDRREREERERKEREERARRDKAKEERDRERERREKEEREKERERDRERDRRRERERGAAEQLRPTSASSRATSEPRQRPPTNQPSAFAGEARRPSPQNPVYSSTGSAPAPAPTARKPQTPVKAVEDWTVLLTQQSPSGDEFQEIPGEAPERRKLRKERHDRMAERAAQALKEKNDRDKAQLMEQVERSMAAGNLDAEIRRWATGKEGNLRALLSSLHLMLWPECNWKPMSLTDLITGISVKKAYQKAILCVHPDKVQQKGATVKQKYIAEKIFDLLKDAFAKFNANELY